ncbi:MAG: hypothetical protein M1835_006408 [Candelina submexicana]|nr:MAG: hypothetical protein M1835_006408 [Candelina submexicana]
MMILGVCRSYNSGFLTTVITCIKASCTDPLSLNVLVSPLELYCSSAGSPINPSAVSDAQHLISQTVSSMSATGTGASGMTTVTLTTTDGNGNQYLAAVPASIGQDTTIFGTPKTVTATSTGSASSTGASSSMATPAAGNGVITTTDAAGKTITTTASSHSTAPSSRSSSSSRGYDAQATNGSPFDMKAQTQAAGAGVANHVARGLLGCCAAAVAGWLLL